MTQEQLDREPCGCPACDDGVQPGHFACSMSSEAMLAREQSGEVGRAYDDGAWHWFGYEPR